jgi:hypothetical protein
VTTGVLLLLASLAPAAGTGPAGMIWPAWLRLRYRAGTASRQRAGISRQARKSASR